MYINLRVKYTLFISVLIVEVLFSQQITKREDKTFIVVIYNASEISKISELDSISELVLNIPKINKKQTIVLKSPSILTSLSIHNTEFYFFKDSLPNIRSLGIEDEFKGDLNIKLNPKNIRSIAIHNFKTSEYNFLERFVNLDTLYVGYKKNPKDLIRSLCNLNQLIFLEMYCTEKSNHLPSEISGLKTIKSLRANIIFDELNIKQIEKITSLSEVWFINQKINSIPKGFDDLASRCKLIFKRCEIKPKTKGQLNKNSNIKFIL